MHYIIICNFLINFCKKKIVLDNDMQQINEIYVLNKLKCLGQIWTPDA